MRRRDWAGLCFLFAFAVTGSTVRARPALGDSVEFMPGGGKFVAATPGGREPLCSRADGGVERCAARYPAEYRDWRESVHGKAYLSGDADAPGCSDCHDDPAVGGIRTASFRLEIPSRCARCHDDPELMRKHGIAIDLYTSYRADYHGATIDYYRSRDSSMWRYEAVCSDCHRSHAVFDAGDPRSSVAPSNLLATCQQCHPGAGTNFTLATAGHFRTDRRSSLLVYSIELIYQLLIPAIIGLMAVYVGLDISYRLRRRPARRS